MNSQALNLKNQTFDSYESIQLGFSCAHFYAQSKWDDQKNRQSFGKCFSKYGHGHDYKLQIWFKCDVDDTKTLKREWLDFKSKLFERMDHKHLNFDFEEFKNTNPTTENIALFVLNAIPKTLRASLNKILLYERPDIWVELFHKD